MTSKIKNMLASFKTTVFSWSKTKKVIASLLALVAFGLGGAGIAAATRESDHEESVPADIAAKAETAALAKVDGTVKEVEAETPDKAEAQDKVETSGQGETSDKGEAQNKGETSDKGETSGKSEKTDPGELADPAGLAYEVEVVKGGDEYEVLLDKNFKVLRVDKEQSD